MTAFIDIETTGLIPKGADWRTDYNQFPYILSFAAKSTSESGVIPKERLKELHKGVEIFFDNGIQIPEEITKINGIDNEKIDMEGLPAGYCLEEITVLLFHHDKIVGHNIFFDSSIIKANVLRHFGPDSDQAKKVEIALHKDKRIDTVRLAQKKFGGKYISLSDLYFKLFNETFEAHSALNDVIALERVYNELVK